MDEIEQEIGRYVKALGQGKLSIGRLEEEISGLEENKQVLQDELHALEQKINESTARDFNAELLQKTLQDFRTSFMGLTPAEQSEALQCVLKNVVVHPQKLALEVFELEEFLLGSQNRKDWLPDLYDLASRAAQVLTDLRIAISHCLPPLSRLPGQA